MICKYIDWSWIPSKMPEEDVIVTGTFTSEKYTLTYKLDGNEYFGYQLESGATVKALAAPSKTGYTFSGWSSVPSTMPAHDVTVTGSFTANKYSLVYQLENEEYKSFSMNCGDDILGVDAPEKEGTASRDGRGCRSRCPLRM